MLVAWVLAVAFASAGAVAQPVPRLPMAPPDSALAVADSLAAPVPFSAELEGAPADSARAYVPAPVPPDLGTPDALSTAPLPRVALVTTPRPVVLLRGGGRARDAVPVPAITEATVQVDAAGRRTLVYTDRPALPADVGAEMGCGPGADRAIARLGTLAEAPLGFLEEGPVVGAAQQLLCVSGYAVPQDGVYGEDMERAVRAFQEDVNAEAPEGDRLVESGTLDPQTRRVLEARARARVGT